MSDHSTELDFAVQAARLGGRIAMGHFGRDPRTERKDDGSWVSEADWAVEAQIRLRIARAFPHHNVLGEEEGLTAAGGGAPDPAAPTWIVDPIDGTNNYLAGIPIWATLVALEVDGRSVLGVAHAPALGETYDAADGSGARLNGATIGVSNVDTLEEAAVMFAGVDGFRAVGLDDFFRALTTRCGRSRGFGDFWGHMLVARGAAEVMVEPAISHWDAAALEPIVREAGGVLTHLDGSRWDGDGSCLTTNGALHDEVVRLAADTSPDWTEERSAGAEWD
ncbi:MAG: inositol monophosphatase [Actinomycetota bacterium]